MLKIQHTSNPTGVASDFSLGDIIRSKYSGELYLILQDNVSCRYYMEFRTQTIYKGELDEMLCELYSGVLTLSNM